MSTRRNVHSKRTLQKTKRIQSGFNNCDYWFSLIPWFSFTPKVVFFTSVLEVKKTTLGFFHLQNGGELNHLGFFYLRFWSWKKPPRFFYLQGSVVKKTTFGAKKNLSWILSHRVHGRGRGQRKTCPKIKEIKITWSRGD